MSYARRPGRKLITPAESLRQTQAALDYYKRLSGKPRVNIGAPAIKQRVASRPTTPKEHYEQVNYVAWFRRTYPTVLIFAIPNGGIRDAVTGFRLKQEGVEPDVPDLFSPAFRLWVEMKRVGGSRPSSQKEMAEYLMGCGYHHFFGMGFEDAKAKTLELFPAEGDNHAVTQAR